MNKITHFTLPRLTSELYEKEAMSSTALSKEIASKINELVDAFNQLNRERTTRFLDHEGEIQKGILYMKDNLANTLYDMFEVMKLNGDFNSIIKDVIEPNILTLNEKTEGVVSATSYGAIGDGIHDDTAPIQKAIDEAFKTNKNVILPEGTFKITSPLKLYDGVVLTGNGGSKTVIKAINEGNLTAAIKFEVGSGSKFEYAQGQKVKDLSITCENGVEFGIYSETPCPYTVIDNISIDFAKNGIYLKNGGWISRISNVTISECETGLFYGNTGTTTIIENVYVTNASKVGYDLNGLTYSQLKNLACDWCKGTAYKFNFCFVIVDGLGCESKEATTGIWVNNSYVTINAPFIFALETDGSKYIEGNGGWLKLNNGSFGRNGNSKAKFIEAQSDFNIELSGIKLNNIDTNSSSYGETNIVNVNTGKGNYSIAPFEKYSFIGKHNTDMFKPENIGYDFPIPTIYGNNLTHPYFGKGVDGNREWFKAKNCGDLFVNQAPQDNGVAMFMQISDTDFHKSSGVITAISGNDVYVSSMDIGIVAEKRNVEISANGILYNKTKEWNKSTIITAVDKANNKITVQSASNLSVGDHFYYKANLTYMREVEYGYVQLNMSGNTSGRPANPRTGMQYFDTSINKPIWWNGSKWVDANGSNV